MKKLTISAFVGLMLIASQSDAATISIFNLQQTTLTAILPESGSTGLTSGVIAIGTFATEPVSISNVLSSFNQAGGASQTIGFFGASAPGYFQGSINTGTLGVGDGFVGNNLYVVIGNGTTLAESNQLLVWKAITNPDGNVFTADSPTGGPANVQVLSSTGTLLFGTVQSNFDPDGAGTEYTAQNAFRLAAIPEPSTSLLAAFGVIALLRRRRR